MTKIKNLSLLAMVCLLASTLGASALKAPIITKSDVSKDSITLGYSAPSIRVKSYTIYRKDLGTKEITRFIGIRGNTFKDTDIEPKARYSYTVVAIGIDGTKSKRSDAIVISTLGGASPAARAMSDVSAPKSKHDNSKLTLPKGYQKPRGFKVRYDNAFFVGGALHDGSDGIALGLSSSTFFGYEFGNNVGLYVGLHGGIIGNYLNDEPNPRFTEVGWTGLDLGVLLGLNFSSRHMSFMPYIGGGASLSFISASYAVPLTGLSYTTEAEVDVQPIIYYGLRMEVINTRRTRFVFGIEGSYQTSPQVPAPFYLGKGDEYIDILNTGMVRIGINLGVAYVTL